MTSLPGRPAPRVARVTRVDELTPDLIDEATSSLARLVADGAALGWVTPPDRVDVTALLRSVVEAGTQDACLVIAGDNTRFAGLGYWLRYARPTHRPHADIEKLAVSPDFQRRGVGRALLAALIGHARVESVEMLTLDFRGDNAGAESLYRSMGFAEYGRLRDFVAPDEHQRFDMVMHAIDLRKPTLVE
ncbi:GNAT family N-acetyltransferase [Leekyejoonella antrihumi]|uniref:GNAT family N-acetyltransferase n=1 Tax=Leekyejoonella antrihumi TaxID=1660198 RepID=A0A563DX62_9MICO|nr:GNAT family N-acetyltransferase [Leekyejoonella antrihumi]TWP34878.1 GNAT family N-acetyltransferase [Leekyejoonella antrihumi]